jgi:hypothetical protein
MTDYLTLTEFVPGAKAKAQDVNANFTAIKNSLAVKASLTGDSAQNFKVANATGDSHAVNKGQLDDLSDDLTAEINKTGTRFCVKSGNITSGKGDLFSYSVLTITPKIGGTYANLIISDYIGNNTTISSVTPSTLNLTGNSDGTYNIFVSSTGGLYILNNTIYRQAARPTMVVNDIWLNTSKDSFACIKYSGTADVEFLDVLLGKVTISSGAITAIETFAFNQNGYNVNSQTTLNSGTNLASSVANMTMPNYAGGVTKTWATVYQADTNGYVYIWAPCGSKLEVSTDDSTWHTVQYSWYNDQGYSASSFVPIPKGVYYKATYTSTNASTSLVFYPCLAG